MSDKQLNPFASERLIDIKEVADITGLKRATIYKWIKESKFPKPLKLGEKASRWKLSSIMDWIGTLPQA